jgi:hypothetical protein
MVEHGIFHGIACLSCCMSLKNNEVFLQTTIEWVTGAGNRSSAYSPRLPGKSAA